METSSGSSDNSMSSSASSGPSVENLMLSVANLSLTEGRTDTKNHRCFSPRNCLLAANGGSLQGIQETRINRLPRYQAGFANSTLVPPPLFPGTIWGSNSLGDDGWDLHGSRLQSGARSYVPILNSPSGTSVVDKGASSAGNTGLSDYSVVRNQEKLNNVRNFICLLQGDRFVNYCLDKEGSRTLHGLLSLRDPEITRQICKKVLDLSSRGIPIFIELMLNQHGWHVVSELIDSLNHQQLRLITYEITKDLSIFITLTFHTHGSNLIKKVIRILRRSHLISFVTNNLCAAFLLIMTNRIGSYVVSECLNHLRAEDNKALYEAAITWCLDLAIDHEGSIALIRVINTIQGLQRYRLLNMLSRNAVFLSQDPEGNYVIQKVISLNIPLFTQNVCHLLIGHYETISLQKGGSHIVEKCLDTEWKSRIIENFLSNTNTLLRVAKDEFGNYVIQKALKVTKKSGSPLYHKLLSRLKPHLSILQSGYGRNVFNLITGGQSVKKV
ncbi:PREDICTED: pumilio homolog 12-like [Populus euphratica]|uniref:Pumilio homolog 12-like n=1 Tax=Populus euphratica TaxID=75702 RepID=A0AAJ6Y0U2_POPEU|nr:PREDICTED: pumilio homolog 12-like [Populus euphratica]